MGSCQPLGVLMLGDDPEAEMELGMNRNRVCDKVENSELEAEVAGFVRAALEGPVVEAFGRKSAWFELPQVLRYSPGGFYQKHADSELRIPGTDDWLKNMDRDISILLYLNDDFEGGRLKFSHFNYAYQPRAGDLLFFPSDHRYTHEATPLAGGLRFVVVSWAAFEAEPRVQETPMPGSVIV